MASIFGSDESISKLSIHYQTSPRTATVDPTMVDLHANGYVNGSLLFTRFCVRLPRNATTQSKSLLIDSDNLDLYGRAADPQYADKGSHECCNNALPEMRLSRAF